MAVKTDTLLMLGGLGLLGFGMFYMMNKSQSPSSIDQRAIAATDAAAAAGNVQSQAMYNQMLAAMQQMMKQVNSGGLTKKQAEQQLTAQYVQMGIQGATAMIGAIGSFF